MKWTPPPGFWAYRGLPEPRVEVKFHPERKWRFDYCWPHAMVAVEIEGGIFSGGGHVRGAMFLKNQEKYNEATRMGWKVYKFIPEQMATDRMIRPNQLPKNYKGKIETTSEFLRRVLT